MVEQKFFRCKKCGNLMGIINNSGVPIICCGEPMEELHSNTVEASTEKHIPQVSVKERLVHVKIGSVPHPMTEEHHIEFIYLQTENGGQMRCLKVESEADAMFAVLEEKPLAAYAYCNLHGLWKVDIENPVDEQDLVCSAEFTEGCI